MKQKTTAGPRAFAGPQLLGTALLASSWLAGPAAAQATHPPAAQATHPAAGLQPQNRSGSVLTPPAQVDPGMTRPVPDMPAQSTPVIHPRELRRTRHGTLQVVPR